MADDIMMSDELRGIWEGTSQGASIKVTSPLQGNFSECGIKNGKKYYSFTTDNISGSFDLLDGTNTESFIINYGEKKLSFNIEGLDIHLEYLSLVKKMKVILKEPNSE